MCKASIFAPLIGICLKPSTVCLHLFKLTFAVSIIAALVACGQTEPQSANTAKEFVAPVISKVEQNDLDLTASSIIDRERQRIPIVGLPPYLKYYKDPAFGAKVIRITDSGFGEVSKSAYSTMQAWNADESLLLLYRTGAKGAPSGHYLHDGKTYEPIRKLDISPTDLEEVFWSFKDPSSFFYVGNDDHNKSQLLKANALTGEEQVIFDFSEFCGPRSTPSAGGDVQMQSYDDDVFGLRCGSEKSMKAFSFKVSEKSIQSMRIGPKTRHSAWYAPTPAPSGKKLLLDNSVYGVDMGKPLLFLDFESSEHASLGKTVEGDDALFYVSFNPAPKGCDGDMWNGIGHLMEYNLDTGSCRPVINQASGFNYTIKGTHVSAVAIDLPGWVAMSSIGYESLDFLQNDFPAPALLSEVYLVNTDPASTEVYRLAHHRSHGKAATKGGYKPYFGEPQASISPTGTRIIFGSDWYDSGSVNSFVIELPGYKR